MEIEDLKFHKVDGTAVTSVEEYVKNWVKENPHGKVIIGCDSQLHGRKIKYSIAIVMHYIDRMGGGHGAHVLIANVWQKRLAKTPLDEMPTKLWREAEYALAAAQMVDGNDALFKKKITIHLDYSDDANNKSNIMYASGIGYLSGMGYKALGKPDAYCASHTADHFVR